MRVLFSTTAGAGHFGPMVPIARACIDRGHDVLVAAPGSFADHVQRTDLSFHPVPDVPADQISAVFERLPSLPHEEANRLVIGGIFGRLDAQAALPATIEVIADWRPDVIVREPAEFASLVAAAKFELPQVQVAIGLDSMMESAADVLEEPLRTLESLAGVDQLGAARVAGTSTFSSVPARLDTSVGQVWRYSAPTAATGPALPADFGDPAHPLVYVTFGSVTATLGPFGGIYPAVVSALAELPLRVLLTTGTGYDLDSLGPLPANTWATQWWPQDAAMREAALVVGHGGFGTTMSAISAGVPQIVMPLFAGDQFVNAARIQAVGAGRELVGGPDRLGELPAMVSDVLADSRFSDVARELAVDVAALPEVATVVDVLEQMAASG